MKSPAEVDAPHVTVSSLGYMVMYSPTDERWGVREFHLRHPDGQMVRVSASTGEAHAEHD